ncbi:MAG: response regulator, partial [Desulfamplus sp.]|nr:response regulator [Desulfamplus sp.]
EAVDAYRQKKYDLILMDIQMPVKDGYQATSEIREIESALKQESPDSGNIPVIAMTAHALAGYKEKCLQNGMDDYLTKPLKREKVLEMVDKWLQVPAQQNSAFSTDRDVENYQEETSDSSIDYEQALEEFGGDKNFLDTELCRMQILVKDQLAQIRKALENGDTETIAKESHKIKGGAANLTAIRLSSAAARLEQMARTKNLVNAGELIDIMEKELNELKKIMAHHENENAFSR